MHKKKINLISNPKTLHWTIYWLPTWCTNYYLFKMTRCTNLMQQLWFIIIN